ncbi:MAG: hypothetical protein K2Y25_00755 [Pseudomonadaceae bacterium]|nr:hypothetical protein [Pseudomonadaceae bacterium]
MAGFSSQDAMINEISVNGKFNRADWQKSTFATTAQAAGLWYNLQQGGGNPAAATVLGGGTNLAFQALTDATAGGGGIPHGGNVGNFKHLLNVAAQTAAATVAPAVLMLVDMLGFYPITTVTTTGAQTLNNSVALPRYANGAGVQALLVPSTVMGAATPNISLGYTNSAAVAGRATPATLPIGNSAAAVTSIVYSGTGAGKFGPFMPLQSGDAGIKSVESINLSASYLSGVLNLMLCKPLLTLPITTLGVTAERDLVNQFMSMPKVYDGACLQWLMLAGAATPVASPISGHLEFGWS